MIKQTFVGACALLSLTSCGGQTQDEDEGSTSEALAPAGSNATYVGTTMKSTWYPGERGLVSVTMQNTGSLGASNDWTTAAYALSSLDGQWEWTYQRVGSTVSPGGSTTFSFVVGAPASLGAQTLSASMQALGRGSFGAPVSIPVTVSTGASRQKGCTYLPGSSTLPSTMAPGESRSVTVTVQNAGSDDWTSGMYLGSYDTPRNLWNQTNVLVGGAVASGASKSWTLTIRAPSSAGAYRFQREMFDPPPGNGFFQRSNFCIDVPITVSGTVQDASTVASTSFPSGMGPGETATVTVRMNNTGAEGWTNDGNFVLYTRNSPANLWGTTSVPLTTATPNGGTATFVFNVTAPSSPGTYTQMWGMRKVAGANAGLFGAVTSVSVPVSGSTMPGYGSTITSQNFPTSTGMTPGSYYPVTIVMKNAGSKPWSGTTFGLRSESTPPNAWGPTFIPLAAADTIAPGADKTFSFYVKAPSDNTITQAWRMTQTNGVGGFGAIARSVTLGHDCTEIHNASAGAADGIYQIDLDGAGPNAAFPVYCDMTNGGWTQVNDQDVNVASGYLPKATWFAGVNTTAPNAGQWGILDKIASFARSGGDYQLRMTYGQAETQYATWVQSNSPLMADPGTLSSLTMVPANQTGCGLFSGMGQNDGNSALDGNIGGCWWFAVGSQSPHEGALPAFDNSAQGKLITDRIRLYMKR